MMDSSRLIPSGFHHAARRTYNGITSAGANLTYRKRLDVAPVDYFFIDFGLSTRFRSSEDRALVTGKFGQNKTVPELSVTVPYDPFKVDIYQLGGVIQELVEVSLSSFFEKDDCIMISIDVSWPWIISPSRCCNDARRSRGAANCIRSPAPV